MFQSKVSELNFELQYILITLRLLSFKNKVNDNI